MAKPKSAAAVAEELKAVQEAASKPATLETPAKGVVSRSTAKFMIQAFGVINIPAASYKAAESDKLDTHMYHSADCLHPLKQSYACEFCNTKVENARSAAATGIEVGEQIILITKDEMVKAQPIKDGVLKISAFVPAESIDVIYYESTEYVAADKGGEKSFATFQQGLALSGRVAIGTIVSRGHQYTVALRPYGQNGIVMSYLYADYEVRTCGKWKPVQTNPTEVALFQQLMSETELALDKFTPAEYDPYLANMREVIRKKSNGETVDACSTEEEPTATGTDGLLSLLQATLNQTKAKAASGK
jgi:DNA end-binding protein Ku